LGFKDGNTVGDDYQYDVNGNMVQDLNKGIQSITYNHLNLPRLITFAANKSIEYTYDANGTKLRKTVIDGGVTKITNYVGPLVYEGASDIFLNTEEGRVVLKEGGFLNEEYQYHLKDHLGNVRVTFTTVERLGGFYSSSMEQEDSDIETMAFKNVDETRHTDMVFNHTEGGKSSARLNAAEGRVVGPSLNLHLQAGDTVKMEVYARYIEKARKKQSLAGIGALIAASLGTTPAGEIPEVIDAVKGALGMGHLSTFSQDQSIPKAYLQYLFFDKSFNFVNAGFRQVSKEAENDFELLSLDYTADQEGYLMMFVANETADDLNVFFDDFGILHSFGPIIRTDDYYPFGLTYNTSELNNALTNKYLYNGKELQQETEWYDYGWRNYDAVLGRFHSIDAFADKYYSLTPYQYGANNPIKYIDVNGDSLMLFKNGVYVATVDNGKEEITGYNQLSTTDKKGNEKFTGGYGFGFNDIETDKAALMSGEMTVELISNDAMEKAANGANEARGDESRYSFIYRESRLQHDGSKGKMDFWATSNIMKGDNVLHVARSKAGDAVGYNGSDLVISCGVWREES
jgi:RHS repeat-associated protein